MNNRDQETKPSALLGFSVKGGSVRWDIVLVAMSVLAAFMAGYFDWQTTKWVAWVAAGLFVFQLTLRLALSKGWGDRLTAYLESHAEDDDKQEPEDHKPPVWTTLLFGSGYLVLALFCQWLVIHYVVAWDLLPINEAVTYAAISLVVAAIEGGMLIHTHRVKKSGEPWDVVVLQALTWYGHILFFLGMLLSIPAMVYVGYRGLVLTYNALSVRETGEVTGAVRYNVAFIFLIATAVLIMYVRNRKKNPQLAKVNQFALYAAAIAAVLALVLLTTYS